MRAGRIGFVRRTVTDDAAEHDKGRPVVRFLKRIECRADRVQIIGIGDVDDVPAQPLKPYRDVFGEGEIGVAFDCDMVVVVDPTEIGQL